MIDYSLDDFHIDLFAVTIWTLFLVHQIPTKKRKRKKKWLQVTE